MEMWETGRLLGNSVLGLLSAVLCYCVGNCTCYFMSVLLSVLFDASVTVWVTVCVTASLLLYMCYIVFITMLLSVCVTVCVV